jgi:DNA-directed RNA polymerase delta subunit
VIYSIIEAMEFALETDGEPLSPYWLASQMEEMRLWRASEHDVRAALEKDINEWGERSQFVKVAEDEWGLRKWEKS